MPGSYLRGIAQPLAGKGPLLKPSRRWPVRPGEERPPAAHVAPLASEPEPTVRPPQFRQNPPHATVPISDAAAPTGRVEYPALTVPSPADKQNPPLESDVSIDPAMSPDRAARKVSATGPKAVAAEFSREPPRETAEASSPRTFSRDPASEDRPAPAREIELETGRDKLEPLDVLSPATASGHHPAPSRAVAADNTPGPPPQEALRVEPAASARATALPSRRAGTQAAPSRVDDRIDDAPLARPEPHFEAPLSHMPRTADSGSDYALKIGTIEVRVSPSPIAPVAAPAPVRRQAATPSPLSRGFASSFGLRQG